jgi:hypothetical protein
VARKVFVAESSPSLLRAQIALAAFAELPAGSEVLLGLVGQPPNSSAAHSGQNTSSPSATSM